MSVVGGRTEVVAAFKMTAFDTFRTWRDVRLMQHKSGRPPGASEFMLTRPSATVSRALSGLDHHHWMAGSSNLPALTACIRREMLRCKPKFSVAVAAAAVAAAAEATVAVATVAVAAVAAVVVTVIGRVAVTAVVAVIVTVIGRVAVGAVKSAGA